MIEHSRASNETHAMRSASGSRFDRVFSELDKKEHIWLVPLIKDKPSFADNSTPISPLEVSTSEVGAGPPSVHTSPSPISAKAMCERGAKSPEAPKEPIRGTTGMMSSFR